MKPLYRQIEEESRMAYHAARKNMWHQWAFHASQAIGMLRSIVALISEGRLELAKQDDDGIFIAAAMLEDQIKEAQSGKLPKGITNVAHALWREYVAVLDNLHH